MSSKNTRNPVDLNHTLLFVEVVRAGSFAQAGHRLGMPANSVSRKIGQLESQLGSRLIHRSTRKLSLTAAGREFFVRCEPSVSALVLAGKEWSDGGTPAGKVIRVAAPTDFFDVFRLEWIAEFLTGQPRLRMEFVLDDAKADLIMASIDVAFRAKHLVEAWHVGHKLIDSYFALVASPQYLTRRGSPATPQALVAHDCLVQSSQPGPVIWQLQGPDGPQTIEVTGRFRANASRVVLQAALAGLGIALLPDAVTAPDIASGHLVRVLPRYRRDGADLYAVYVSRHQIPQTVTAFVSFATEKIRSALTHSFPPLRNQGNLRQLRTPQSENITR